MLSYLPGLAILTTALILAGVALVSISSAQTPQPTGEPPPVCPPNRPEPRAAASVSAGPITVQMPEGRYYVLELPGDPGFVNICLEGAGGVRLAADCTEVSRYVEEDANALDGIVDSCEVSASAAPTATPTLPPTEVAPTASATAAATDESTIRPPDTGSAGLQ